MTPEKPESPIDRQGDVDRPLNRFSLLSHDLRSALSDVLGGLHLIDHDQLSDENRQHFDRISVAGETLVRLLDKTVTEEQSTVEEAVTRAVNINLSDFLTDIRKRWLDHAREKGIEFEIRASQSLPAILTLDRVALDRVIANLVGNAVKFTDDGVVVLSVSSDADKALCFRVEDDGPGFSNGASARLFQYEGRPLDTGKPGSGLGLYIAKELTDLMGGSLVVRNRQGPGAEVVLKLPYEAWFDRSLRRDAKARDVTELQDADLSGLRILLAEDNMTNQLVATQMLGAMGAEFAVASDGLEALELLETQVFDLALLDIEMPRMSGLELIKAIRSKPATVSEMPLVALTAYVMREHRERIYGAGANGIIAKPLMSIQELGHAILEYIDAPGPGIVRQGAPVDVSDAEPGEVVNRGVFDTLVETIGADSTAELLGKLQADTDTVAEGLVRGQRSLDLSEIRSQTHILISVAGAIGARRLQLIAQRLNAAANRQEPGEIETLCEECLSGLAELQGFILTEQATSATHPVV